MININDVRKAELESIRAAHGGVLKPEHVVEFARNKRTALHSAFEWDDDVAAEKYRLTQARLIIRIMVMPSPMTGELMPVNVSIMEDRKQPGGGYRSAIDVMSNPEMRRKLLRTALIEMVGFRKRYRALTELAQIFELIDATEQRLNEEDETCSSM
jgi:hypothetical protein